MIRVGFDIGGVLTKYPEVFRPLVTLLETSPDFEVHVLSDMSPHSKCVAFVRDNGFIVSPERIHSCEYDIHGELCKTIKSTELGLDV